MGLVVAHMEEDVGENLADTNNVAVGGLPRDWNKGLSGLCQLEGELFMQHGALDKSMEISIGLPAEEAVVVMIFCQKRHERGWHMGRCWYETTKTAGWAPFWRLWSGAALVWTTCVCGFTDITCDIMGVRRSGQTWQRQSGRLALGMGGLRVCFPDADHGGMGARRRGQLDLFKVSFNLTTYDEERHCRGKSRRHSPILFHFREKPNLKKPQNWPNYF